MQLSFKPLNNFSSLPSKTVWLKLTYFQKEILGTTTKFPCKRLPHGWPEQECLAGCFMLPQAALDQQPWLKIQVLNALEGTAVVS